MCVVLAPWATDFPSVALPPEAAGRTVHAQLEDQGVDGEEQLVLRNHWASRCPLGTDCPLGSDKPAGEEEGHI